MPVAYFVYILASSSRCLYVGVTNDARRRLREHRSKQHAGFTRRYNVNRLVYIETTPSVHAAIEREKQLKGWARRKKVALIETFNPGWKDLAREWGWDVSTRTLDPS